MEKMAAPDCPFTFEKPTYTEYVKDSMFFDEKPIHPCWFDLKLSELNGAIHFSYYPMESRRQFDNLISDAFKLSGKHNKKANYIDERPFNLGDGVSGIVFELEGPVASPFQFFITDSTNHFLRGSLYFNAKVNRDSIKPIYEFVRADILQLIEGFEWE